MAKLKFRYSIMYPVIILIVLIIAYISLLLYKPVKPIPAQENALNVIKPPNALNHVNLEL